MKIIIPMSGFGERFRLAGYTMPKPLIEIDGKSIASADEAIVSVRSHSVGDVVKVKYQRGNITKEVTLKLVAAK